MKRYYVYMLKCSDGSFYVGVTSAIEVRIAQHQTGWNPRCYTHERRPVKLVHVSEFIDVHQAIAWEKQLKGWSRKKKIALMMGDFEKIHEHVAAQRHGRAKRA
ncbi:MAG TPA: GIY-YIG nuclease family protein [Candidatus Aquilonibacter sp.]|nr:GIY-YIG nuclease family protein [Candidatus Aquilonibacter sp.]